MTTTSPGKKSGFEKRGGFLKQLTAYRETGVFIALLLFFGTMMFVSPTFRQPYNLTIVLKQISVTAVMAMGQTLVMISGAFDLSQGSIAGLAAMVGAKLWADTGWSPLITMAVALGVGVLCGMLNGTLAARFRLHTTVMTLATGIIFRGLIYFYTEGYPVTKVPAAILFPGAGLIGPVPAPIVIMFVLSFLSHILLTRTIFGRRLLQIGGNESAAMASGIQVEQVRIAVFAISGFLSALGGLMFVGRVGNAIPTIGLELLFPVVIAAIVGGTLLSGGVGSVLGTLMGAAIMGILANAVVVLRASIYLQDVFQGSLTVVALLVDQFRRGELNWAKVIGKEH